MQNHSHENEFISHVNKTCILMNVFALGLGFKRRLRATRKWAISIDFGDFVFLFSCIQ